MCTKRIHRRRRVLLPFAVMLLLVFCLFAVSGWLNQMLR